MPITSTEQTCKILQFCSSLGTPCGIATYTEMLAKAQRMNVTASLSDIRGEHYTCLHVQHEFGLMSLRELKQVDAYCRQRGIQWYITMHTVVPLPSVQGYLTFRSRRLLGRIARVPGLRKACRLLREAWERRRQQAWLANPAGREWLWHADHPDYTLRTFLHLRRSQQFILKRANKIIVHQSEARQALEDMGARRVEVVPHGICEVPVSSALHSQQDGRLHVGCFGFLKPHKRILEIIQACEAIPNLTLHIYASTAHRDQQSAYVQAVLAKAREHDWIDLHTEHLPLEEVVYELSQCDKNVWYCDTPGGISVSGSVRQYVAAMRPIIASQNVMISDISTLVCSVPPNDIAALSAAIRSYHCSPAGLRACMRRSAWQYVRATYDGTTDFTDIGSAACMYKGTLKMMELNPRENQLSQADILQRCPASARNPLAAYRHRYDNGYALAPPTDRKIIFLHVPRTGGSTITSIMRRNVRSLAFRKDFSGQPNVSIHLLMKIFRALPPEEQERERRQWDRYDALANHGFYGVHELLSVPYSYFTILRHPFDRLLSHYRYLNSLPRTNQTGDVLPSAHVSHLSFYEFVMHPGFRRKFVRNHSYVQLLAGTHDVAVTQWHVERAKAHLQDFDAVLIQERFEESMQLLCQLYNWQDEMLIGGVPVKRDGKVEGTQTHSTGDDGGLSAAELQHVLDVLRLDIELYEFAKHVFDKQLREHGLPVNNERVEKQTHSNKRPSSARRIRVRPTQTLSRNAFSSQTLIDGETAQCSTSIGAVLLPTPWYAKVEQAGIDPFAFDAICLSFFADKGFRGNSLHRELCKRWPQVDSDTIKQWLFFRHAEGIVWSVIERDEYGLRALQQRGYSPHTILDIGGHIGSFALLAAHLWPDARIVTCEPEAVSGGRCSLLHTQLRSLPHVDIIPKAIVGMYGNVLEPSYVQDFEHDTLNHLLEFQAFLEPSDRHPKWTSLSCLSVASLLAEAHIDSLDFLKIDCEGCETNILRELQQLGRLAEIEHIRGEWHGKLAQTEVPRVLSETHEVSSHRLKCGTIVASRLDALHRSPELQCTSLLATTS